MDCKDRYSISTFWRIAGLGMVLQSETLEYASYICFSSSVKLMYTIRDELLANSDGDHLLLPTFPPEIEAVFCWY